MIGTLLFCLCASLCSAATVQERITAHISQEKFAAATWGIKVESLATGEVWFEHNAGKLLIPASNTKLFTAALALDRLGPDHRIRTSVFAGAPPNSHGTVSGDLVIYGRGDPMFAARYHEGNYDQSLAALVKAIRKAGVTRVRGDLVGDETCFHTPPAGTGWDWDDLQYYYGAEASALTVEENVVDLAITPGPGLGLPCRINPFPENSLLQFVNRTTTGPGNSKAEVRVHRPLGSDVVYVAGSVPFGAEREMDAVTVHQPARLFLDRLRTGLARGKVSVGGDNRVVSWPEAQGAVTNGLVEIASIESPPLAEIVTATMKRSQNLYAQLLLLQVGAWREGRSGLGQAAGTTESLGLAEMRDFLAELGIGPGDIRLQEGAGLSRGCLIKPATTVRLLREMRARPPGEVFRAALPVAGVDGTLARRMKGTAAEGNLRAKTGTLNGVYTLSGYLTTAGGEELVLSLMLNNFRPADPDANPRDELDTIAVMLAETGTAK